VSTFYSSLTIDNIYTIVLENINGTSVTNDCETYIPKLVEEIIKPGRRLNNVIERDKQGNLYPNIRFLERTWNNGEEQYTITQIRHEGSPLWSPGKLELKNDTKPESRTYRRVLQARELPDPFPNNSGDDRCSGHREGTCPLVTGTLPSIQNGCDKCRDIAVTWKAREWLINQIPEDIIRQTDAYEFGRLYPELFVAITQNFADDKPEKARNLYYWIRSYGAYNKYGESSIDVMVRDNRSLGLSNGRHRVKVAQNIDIQIPTLWHTTEKLDLELLE